MPKPTVAILGASTDRAKFGNKSVRAHKAAGYTVYPVNPKADAIEGIAAYSSLADIPIAKPDRVSVYLPPAVTLAILDQIAAKGCEELWLNPGSYDAAVVARAEALGLAVVCSCSILDVGHSPSDFPD